MADITAKPPVRQYPEHALRFTENSLDPTKLTLSYDRPSDTLLVLFQGRERRAVVVGGTDYSFLLVDPETNEVVGLQIEDFLARAVNDEPRLIELIRYAELRGMTPDQAHRERQRVLGPVSDVSKSGPRHPRTPEEKQALVWTLLRDARFGLPIKRSRGAA